MALDAVGVDRGRLGAVAARVGLELAVLVRAPPVSSNRRRGLVRNSLDEAFGFSVSIRPPLGVTKSGQRCFSKLKHSHRKATR
jgi:hypothetical protein